MTTCLLCPALAVADGLCVDDGARLWAARLWAKDADLAVAHADFAIKHPERVSRQEARAVAFRELSTPEAARAFLDRHEAAKAARAAAPVCPRGCKSHDGEEGQ